jgi:hypothetical protein
MAATKRILLLNYDSLIKSLGGLNLKAMSLNSKRRFYGKFLTWLQKFMPMVQQFSLSIENYKYEN